MLQLVCSFTNLAPIIEHLVTKSHDPGANASKTTIKSIPVCIFQVSVMNFLVSLKLHVYVKISE